MKHIFFNALLVFMVLGGCNLQSETLNNSITEEENQIILQEIDTSLWKTYLNEEYNFKLKYPSDFALNEGLALEGTSSEHYSISFSKNGKEAWLIITPDGVDGSRIEENSLTSEQIIAGKKAVMERWSLDNGSEKIHYKFSDQINNWEICGPSIYCTHISVWAGDSALSSVVKKMLSTFEFTQD
jgi:hypothetical protein